VIQRDPHWLDWSLAQLEKAAQTDGLVINPIVCAELAPNFDTSQQLMQFVKTMPLIYECSYLAGSAQLEY
jgi:hypothetical protein